MNKDEMKNRISMALKDPILQQGFEIICKENAELKEKLKPEKCLKSMNLYEKFYKKQLPKDLQEETEGFASQGKSTGEVLFRIGYYIGRNFEKYREELCLGYGGDEDESCEKV